jgi:hypothetical protein
MNDCAVLALPGFIHSGVPRKAIEDMEHAAKLWWLCPNS